MKWNLFVCATALTSYLLITHGAPLLTVVTGTAAAGLYNFMRRKR